MASLSTLLKCCQHWLSAEMQSMRDLPQHLQVHGNECHLLPDSGWGCGSVCHLIANTACSPDCINALFSSLGTVCLVPFRL